MSKQKKAASLDERNDVRTPSINDTVQNGTTSAGHTPVARSTGETGSVHAVPSAPRDPYLRPANEDDDGYDPYSDRREEPPLFEPNPWD